MHPGVHARTNPDKPAAILHGSGEVLTFRQLDERSIQLARLLQERGLKPGDHISIFMDNRLEYFECFWAGARSGIYVTAINRYLKPEETAYILRDSTSRAVITSASMKGLAAELPSLVPEVDLWLSVDGGIDGYEDYRSSVDQLSTEPLEQQPRGDTMLYSSGTTGRPKGIKRPLSGLDIDDPEATPRLVPLLQLVFGVDDSTTYLSPAPLYHSAPLGFTTTAQALGATVVVMEKFDALEALRALDEHHITHSQWVPTMFTRMLKLPEEQRQGFDWSSHKVAIHAAAPCPVEVKKQMFDLWGPIINEYYAGTEVNGFVFCSPDDWLAHPGTVGRSILGTIRICDDEGIEVPAGQPGTIYFEREEVTFEYHNDPAKTRGSQHPDHVTWSTLGDVGYVDEEGFLFLTDRKAFMIISGGVNIYPQEIEDCLIMHPMVADVAVIGVPNADMGEEVKAVVQVEQGVDDDDELAAELIAYAAQHLARYKVPASVDFRPELPRLPTGKLYKRLLRDEYWGSGGGAIV